MLFDPKRKESVRTATSRSRIYDCFNFVVILLLGFGCGLVVSIAKYGDEVGQRFNQEGYSAVVLARALLVYENDHHGSPPLSLSSLDLDAAVASDESPLDKDATSRFHLLPPGTRTGARPVDVVFEAPQESTFPSWARFVDSFPDCVIRIYKDGQVSSELKTPPHS